MNRWAVSNSETRLFVLRAGRPNFLSATSIERIRWREGGKPRIVVSALIKQSLWLEEYTSDFDLVVKHGLCSRPDNFSEGDTLINLERCRQLNKWVWNAVNAHKPYEGESVKVFAAIECDAITING